MLTKLSLAPFSYGQSMFDRFFETITVKEHFLLDGTKVFSANSFLREEHIPSWKTKSLLYSNCDGSGTSSFRNEAIYKSISEGIERFAFYENYQNTKFGFDLNCSTTGLAAFPGLFARSARRYAHTEAVERWCLARFWEGSLSLRTQCCSNRIVENKFRTPFEDVSFTIVYSDFATAYGTKRAYGFSGGRTETEARNKAVIELSRNADILKIAPIGNPAMEMDLLEKRLLFFASSEGVALFDSAIDKSRSLSFSSLKKPKAIIDAPIHGIWDKHCKVYRVLFPDSGSSDTSEKVFIF